MRDVKSFLANLSHHPGVYQMLGEDGEILYVGKAKDLKKRVTSYFSKQVKDPKTISLVKQINDIVITVTHSENEAVLLECNLIKQHRPRYNILLRDDKSYPYIHISNHPYPRIDIYRGQRKKNGLYFGPYPSSLAVRETISLIQKLFRIRTCRDPFYDARTRPCLLYQIGRCTGPCVELISEDAYAQNVQLAILFLKGKSNELVENLQQKMEAESTALNFELAAQYRDQISRLRQIQDKQYVNVAEGNADIIGLANQAGAICIQLLSIRGGQVLGSRSYFPTAPANSHPYEIITAFLTQHYLSHPSHMETIPREIIISEVIPEHELLENVLAEQAKHKVEIICPQRGDKTKWLNMAITSAKQTLSTKLATKANIHDRLLALQSALNLKKIPRRVECFDISHSMGEATVASCVVFDTNGPVKSDYRRFNITDITPGDDVAAMHQVISRRFKKLQKDNVTLPDIIFIDGGKTQLAAAEKVMTELNIDTVLLVGVSKGPDRKPGFETLHFTNKQAEDKNAVDKNGLSFTHQNKIAVPAEGERAVSIPLSDRAAQGCAARPQDAASSESGMLTARSASAGTSIKALDFKNAMHLPSDSLALHFIQQIRDEAHRFAITGHRQRRDKARRHSQLELIPGIGSKRRRELLRYFGGIQGIAHASLDELLKVPGINQSLAERIFAALHDATI